MQQRSINIGDGGGRIKDWIVYFLSPETRQTNFARMQPWGSTKSHVTFLVNLLGHKHSLHLIFIRLIAPKRIVRNNSKKHLHPRYIQTSSPFCTPCSGWQLSSPLASVTTTRERNYEPFANHICTGQLNHTSTILETSNISPDYPILSPIEFFASANRHPDARTHRPA